MDYPQAIVESTKIAADAYKYGVFANAVVFVSFTVILTVAMVYSLFLLIKDVKGN